MGAMAGGAGDRGGAAAVAAAARQPGHTRRPGRSGRLGGAGADPARRPRRGRHRRRQRSRCNARARLRACAGALLRNGPDAPRRRRRAVRVARQRHPRHGPAAPRAPFARARHRATGRLRRQPWRGIAGLQRRRQWRPARAAGAAVAVSAAVQGPARMAAGGLGTRRRGDVFRPARHAIRPRTGAVPPAAALAGSAVRAAAPRRQQLGRRPAHAGTRRRGPARRQPGRPAPPAGRRAQRRRPGACRTRQQQLGDRRQPQQGRPRHRRQRHASAAGCAQPVVRVRLRYADAQAPGGRVDVAGFSLPGLPAVVVGSNGHVAWASPTAMPTPPTGTG